MRTPLLFALLACSLAASAQTPPLTSATTLKLTVTSSDESVIAEATKNFVAQGATITTLVTKTEAQNGFGSSTPASTTWTVTATRSGKFRMSDIVVNEAQCRTYTTRPNVSCSSTISTTPP